MAHFFCSLADIEVSGNGPNQKIWDTYWLKQIVGIAKSMAKQIKKWISEIHHGDCVAGMNDLPDGSIDLVFADPPFNIGFQYDVYDDKLEHEKYIEWSSTWIQSVYDALKPCLLYTSPSPRDATLSRMPSSA